MDDLPLKLLPMRSNFPITQEYLDNLLNSYYSNRDHGFYDHAFLSAYLIFIYWIYSKIWFLSKVDNDRIKDIFTLHSYDNKFKEKDFFEAEEPTQLAQLKLEERKYGHLFSRLCFEECDTKTFKSLVDDRNKIAHPAANIVCTNEVSIDEKLSKMEDLALKAASHFAPHYLKYYEINQGTLSLKKLLRWQEDYNLEQNLFTKWQLASIDLDSLQTALLMRHSKVKGLRGL